MMCLQTGLRSAVDPRTISQCWIFRKTEIPAPKWKMGDALTKIWFRKTEIPAPKWKMGMPSPRFGSAKRR